MLQGGGEQGKNLRALPVPFLEPINQSDKIIGVRRKLSQDWVEIIERVANESIRQRAKLDQRRNLFEDQDVAVVYRLLPRGVRMTGG
ncbi:MAG: hypothetical protein DLM70_06380 [Chloroflexi bacterium]|nr:MAG: hypothetical protein DLM70_06380 [Chloroflexota bacterium]